MNIAAVKRVYFMGIGGIGMSALARYFNAAGAEVSGYDKTPTTLTGDLIHEGIKIHFEEDIDQIPAAVDLVVYTPAVPTDHAEYRYFQQNNIPILKRAEVLGMISKDLFTIAIAGTHGKTTISCLASLILKTAAKKLIAFIGGISVNLNSNLLLTPGADTLVAEADEYDRSFLNLHPDIAIISAIDPDHLDIYGSYDELKESFRLFAAQIRGNGILICKQGLDVSVAAGIKKITYGLDQGDYHAANILIDKGHFVFDLITPDLTIREIVMAVPGRHNIENAVAAAAVCHSLGISEAFIRGALQSYMGVKRRFEFHVNESNAVYIDDYAHHPKEIEACIATARELYPGKKIAAIFQPHLYTRTRDLANDFAHALEQVDSVILLPVYPARELPIPGVSSQMLFDRIRIKEKMLVEKEELLRTLAGKDFDVLITMGAGDIDQFTEPIRQLINTKIKSATR